MENNDVRDRFFGCIFGLAVENVFTSIDPSKKIKDMVGGGPHKLKPGYWTDDTSMALCLANSLIKKKKMDLVDQLRKYSQWYHKGYMSSTGKCFDIGGCCRDALSTFSRSGKQKGECGPTSRKKSGNGSLMRLGPVPMFFQTSSFEKAVEECGRSSKTTHQSIVCVQCCQYYGGLIWGALNGHSKEALLSTPSGFHPTGDETFWKKRKVDKEVNEIIKGSFKKLKPCKGKLPRIRDGGFKNFIINSGYVVKSMEAALFGFFHTNTFDEGALKIVNLGHDADTVGAIYGMLAGAFYGFDGINKKWTDMMAKRNLLVNASEGLFKLVHEKE